MTSKTLRIPSVLTTSKSRRTSYPNIPAACKLLSPEISYLLNEIYAQRLISTNRSSRISKNTRIKKQTNKQTKKTKLKQKQKYLLPMTPNRKTSPG